MDRFEEDGARLLAPLRDVDPDLRSGVDVTRAMKTGKRRRRNRMLAGVTAAVAVLALSAVVVPGLVSGLRDSQPANGALTLDPTVFDMHWFPVQVGTAGGYTPLSYSVTKVKATVTLERTDAKPGSGEVSMYPVTRFRPDPEAAGFPAATPIEGRRTFWVPGEPRPTLVMEYGTDRWVRVSALDAEPDLQNRVLHIAESVSLDPTPAQVPITVSRNAGGLSPNLLEIQNTRPQAALPVQTSVVKLSYEPLPGTPQVTLTAIATPSLTMTNDYINGHAAYVNPAEIVLADVRGYAVTVTLNTPIRDFGTDRLRALAATVDVVPGAQSRSNWTDNPMR